MMTSKSHVKKLSVLMPLVLLFLLAFMPEAQAKKLNVMTSTTDLAALTKEVGGDKVDVEAVAKGYQDPHFVEAKPSFLLKLRRADLLIVVGLDLEIGWLPPLITQSGNPKVQVGDSGYLDASQFADILDKPTGQVTRAMGDVHPLGNPHYWLDPENGRRIARLFKAKFTQLDPENAATCDANEKAFEGRLNTAERGWQGELASIKGKPVVAWHTSWRYFAEY